MLTTHDLEQIKNIVTVVVSAAIEPLQKDITALKEDVLVLKKDVSILKTDVRLLKTNVARLEKMVESHTKQLRRLDNSMIKKFNLVISHFDEYYLDHERRIKNVEYHLQISPFN